MRRTDTALADLAALPADAPLSDKVELCIWGKSVRRMRDWERWLCVILHPARFNMARFGDEPVEAHDVATDKLLEEAQRKLQEHTTKAIQEGTHEAVSTEIAKATREYAAHDPFAVKLQSTQLRVFNEWAGRSSWTPEELASLSGESLIEALGFNAVRRNALAVLRQVCAAKHPTYAAALMFSRRLKKSLAVHSGLLMDENIGSAAELKLTEFWGHRQTTWRCEALEADSTPEALTATQLRDRVSSLLARDVSPGDISKALKALGIHLPAGKRGRPKLRADSASCTE